MLEPRNNRAQALLEHSDPGLAIMGGPEREIEIRSPQHYLIEPSRGDATKAQYPKRTIWDSMTLLSG